MPAHPFPRTPVLLNPRVISQGPTSGLQYLTKKASTEQPSTAIPGRRRRRRDGAPRNSGNTGQLSHTGPANTLVPKCKVTLMEILTWNPRWYLRITVCLRLVRNGIRHQDVARVIAWTHGLEAQAERKVSEATRHYYFAFAKRPVTDGGLGGPIDTVYDKYGDGPEADLNEGTAHWRMPAGGQDEFDESLMELATGVIAERQPTGADADLLTQCIILAVQRNDHGLKISDIPRLVAEHNLTTPADVEGISDRMAMHRFLTIHGAV